jgi:hypothetical protein
MSPNESGPSMLHLLQQQLELAHQRNQATNANNRQGNLIQVPGTGKAISSAYEQLRNAAEYTEEHLLLQRAIRRFYNRSLSFGTQRKIGSVGEELIVELTQAGYLQNDSFGTHVASSLTQLVESWMHYYWQLRNNNVSREQATDWIQDILSVASEEALNPHFHLNALATFAYNHYLYSLPRDTFIADNAQNAQYEICLYIAAHKTLLKSDIALVRYDLMNMYQQSPANLPAFIDFNEKMDVLFNADMTLKIERSVSKYGAPIRILKSVVESNPDVHTLLHDQERFLSIYEHTVTVEYKNLNRRLTKGILKSIAFIFITKVIIGLGIEVPYDLLFVGSVTLMPLFINLLVPPLYMASLKLGLRPPSPANAKAIRSYMAGILYPSPENSVPALTVSTKVASTGAKVLYTIIFLIPFGITLYILRLLGFNIIQTLIFFVFLSTASFLGFRLSRMIREVELLTKQQSVLSILRDFFYLPFIAVGQWLSSKYARMNIIAFTLDLTIELPLKTILRLFRQWTRFLNEKHDEIYK